MVLGALLCVPAAIGVAIFAAGWADADAAAAAPVCAKPSRDSGACLSLFDGTIAQRIPGGPKFMPQVKIVSADTTVTVGYRCLGACGMLRIESGTPVVTGWWKGQLVAFGPPGERPAVETDASPEYRLGIEAYLLGLVIPAVSLLLAGFFRRQAPSTVNELILGEVARSPDPPRDVARWLLQRVAWGQYLWLLPIVWAVLYLVVGGLVIFATGQGRLAPLVLLVTFVTSIALAAWMMDSYLAGIIRTAARRTIEVRRVDRLSGRGGDQTRVAYALLNGRMATYILDGPWNGRVKIGDRLDAMTSSKSGSIRRVISTPKAQS